MGIAHCKERDKIKGGIEGLSPQSAESGVVDSGKKGGEKGLEPRSTRPKTSPRATRPIGERTPPGYPQDHEKVCPQDSLAISQGRCTPPYTHHRKNIEARRMGEKIPA